MIMKKILLGLAVAGGALSVNAQTSENEWAIGAQFGTTHFEGEQVQELYKFKEVHAMVGLTVTRYINPSVDIQVNLKHGQVDGPTFTSNLFDFNGVVKLKSNNGKIFKEDARIAPYIFLGFGDAISETIDRNTGEVSKPEANFNLPFGAGIDFRLTERMKVTLETHYNHSLTDQYDLTTRNYEGDGFMFNSVGLSYNFTSKKDSDNDGIVDAEDTCPMLAGTLATNGCPDKDMDGVADAEDKCPEVAGLVELGGCADSDLDGVADFEDTCPNEKGLVALGGCPDTDGDGIKDSEDACPKIAGTKEFKGCIDSDGDGIAANLDACPSIKGTIKTNGCPDSDGDGFADAEDECPKLAGTNKGCPVIKDEVKEVMRQAKEGLFFASGSSKIKTSSYKVLDNVYSIMQSNPDYKLSIEGHTDNTGDAAKNLQLSKDRSAAAKAYLVKKGVDASRITSNGFGITKPVADNATPEGRQKNRRVDFNIGF